MRIYFSFIIAAFITVFAVGLGFAQMKGEPCHEKEQRIVVDMKNCVCCSLEAMHLQDSEPGNGVIAGDDCCPPRACGKSSSHKDIALTALVSPVVAGGKTLNPVLIQPAPLWTIAVHRTGLPPPRCPSAPPYIQNCSFLI